MERRGGEAAMQVEYGGESGRGAMVHSNESVTAHQTSNDSWFQAGFVLTTGIHGAYVLGYSGAVMVPLGWAGGVIAIILATITSFHANSLIAKLHEHGGKRHIRYRDLARYIYGDKAYSITWGMQYMNLFVVNVGNIIIAGNSLKAIYTLFRNDHTMKLPYFIVISGLACALFAIFIPHLSALRIWLGFSTFFSMVYIFVGCALSIKDGVKAPPRDYNVPGTKIDRIFTTIGATAIAVFSFNTGMLPEIQATVRSPVVKNMMKGLNFQFTAGVIPLYAIIFLGYWAYGTDTTQYLLNDVSGPIWIKAVANVSAFLHTVIALQIFASPMYEYLDTKYGIKGSSIAIRHMSFRVLVRGGYVAVTTLMAAILPFLGDFMSLSGALSTYPLTYILAHHMYLMAQKNQLSSLQKTWHWLNVGIFGCFAVAAAVSGLRLIIVDSKAYHLFADV